MKNILIAIFLVVFFSNASYPNEIDSLKIKPFGYILTNANYSKSGNEFFVR